jgi:hypothetical protein
VAIRRSAADEIHRLVADLSSTDRTARDTATARLGVYGERAVAHLLDGLASTASNVGRTAIVRVLEATHDRRGLDVALALLADPSTDPGVVAAAASLAGSFLDSDRGRESLETLTALALDTTLADSLRLAALQALAAMPAGSVAPIRSRLEHDPSPIIRAAASQRAGAATHPDPLAALELAAADGPAAPAALRDALARAGGTAPLSTLHRLVESLRSREQAARSDLDRAEWLGVRAAVHQALAARRSRVAVYDLRETLGSGTGVLPAELVAAVATIGDASCLEPLAGAMARAAASIRSSAVWRGQLLAAGRAIIVREKLTRRHAVVRRLSAKWPGVAEDLLAKPH